MGDHLVLILAAGKGTRMKSRYPKVVHPLAGRPMIRYVWDNAKASGARRIVAVVGHKADEVKHALEQTDVEFVHQKEQLGTGHAVLSAQETLDGETGRLLILSGDVPLLSATTIASLLAAHQRSQAGCTLLTSVTENPFGLGRIIRGQDGTVDRIVEEKDASDRERGISEVNSGVYCFRLELLFEVLARCGRDNAQREYYLTDAIAAIREQGLPVVAEQVENPIEVQGINDRVELSMMGQVLNRRKLEELMMEGVTIVAPETTRIDWNVRVGRDTVIHPHTTIEGDSIIGDGCAIHHGSHLQDAVLGDEVTVRSFTLVTRGSLDSGREIGPHQIWPHGG